MIWQGDTLIGDEGETVAEFFPDSGVIAVGAERIDVTHTAGAMRWKAEGQLRGTEERFSARMKGIGVGSLTARCGSRQYQLEREGVMSKKRSLIDANGVTLATTSPQAMTDLKVTVAREIPFEDLAFVTWALTLIDTPGRRTMY